MPFIRSHGVIPTPPLPVWAGAPVYSILEGIPSSFSVPVSIADGSAIVLEWVAPGTQPSWVTLNSGLSPSISFSGDQVDADDVSNMVLSATAYLQTANSSFGSITVGVEAAPQWLASPTFSVAEGQPATYSLPVTVSNGSSITLAWIAPGAQPPWVVLNTGVSPSITFTGTQVDANDLSGVILSATANSQTTNSAPGSIAVSPAVTFLSVIYTADEGTAIRPDGGAMFWQSNFVTNDGTLIEWGTGNHGHQVQNDVAEYDPLTKVQSTVEPSNIISGTYNSRIWKTAAFGSMTQYDNLMYWYVPRIDSLVVATRGQYVRGSSARSYAQKFPLASREEVTDNGDNINNTGTSFLDGQALGWKSGIRLVGTEATSLIRPIGTVNTDQSYIDNFTSAFNPHMAWSKQFDCGVRISGGNGGGNSEGWPFIWFIVPSANVGSYPQPYAVYRKAMPATVGGARPWKYSGRDGCKFVGPHVYWVSGSDTNGGAATRHFFRIDVRPHLLTTDESSTSLVSGSGAIERLPDAPIPGGDFPLLVHDHDTNALLMIGDYGLAMFDLRTLTWESVPTLASAEAAYRAEYSQYSYLGTPYTIPPGCLGDYIRERSGVQVRKIVWRPGNSDDNDGASSNFRQRRYRSIKINRPTDQITPLSFTFENPENTSQDRNSNAMFNDIKHHNLVVSGSGSTRKLTLVSGDWVGYPFGTLSASNGYKPEGSYTESGRQEIWQADISDAALAGSIRFKMVSNAYHAYPWRADLNRGFYNTAQRGPRAADSQGAIYRPARGAQPEQWWIGPCDNNDYMDTLTELGGVGYPQFGGDTSTLVKYSPMFKWTKPGLNSVAVTGGGVEGVALGNGWELPSQDRLYKPGSLNNGSAVVGDFDIGNNGWDSHGWGRVNAHGSVYDATTDRIFTLAIKNSGGAKQFTIGLYAFNPDPDAAAANGGKYAWTERLITRNVKEYGGPPDSYYDGTNTSGWGDKLKGMVNCAPQMIGRKIYFVAIFSYYVASGSPLIAHRLGQHLRPHLLALDVDKALANASDSLEWIPFPDAAPWWLTNLDGPNYLAGGLAGDAATSAQYRSMACVGTKLVLGPDGWTNRPGIDPLIAVFDTDSTKKTWTTFAPPANNDFPNSINSMIGVPDLGEVWLVGAGGNLQYGGEYVGRRILRLKVT